METEGVFVFRDGRAVFVPVKVGIAGERYFEVLSGVNENDRVITGPFNSVREMADGSEVRLQEPQRRRPCRCRPRRHAPDSRVDRDRAPVHLGQQAAVVHDRPRQHRRRDVDRDGRLADPGHERDGVERHRHRRRRRRLHHSAASAGAHRRGRRAHPQQSPGDARRSRRHQAVQPAHRVGDGPGAAARHG